MKKNILFVLILFFPLLLTAQKLKTITKKFPKRNTVEIEYTVLKKRKNVKHGVYKVYFQNGQTKEIGAYDNNKKHGDWKEYSYQGELRRIKKYEKGKLVSDDKFGIWRESGKNGKPYYYDHDKEERIMPPIPIYATYPPKAREDEVEGIVKIMVELDWQCELKKLKIVKSLRADFDEEAMNAVKLFIEKLKYFEEDCKGFEETITIEFKVD